MVNQETREGKLRDILDGAGRNAIANFLSDVAVKMPSADWEQNAMRRMTARNQEFAERNGARCFADLDVRQLLNVLVATANEISRTVAVSRCLESKASAVWAIAKALSHLKDGPYDDDSFRTVVNDVGLLLRMVGAGDDLLRSLVDLLPGEKCENTKETKTPKELEDVRLGRIKEFRTLHQLTYNELWEHMKASTDLPILISTFNAGEFSRLCLVLDDLPDLFDCPYTLQIIVDKRKSISDDRDMTLGDLKRCVLNDFWLDVLRAIWKSAPTQRRWEYVTIPLERTYCVRTKVEGDTVDMSIHEVRLWLERDGCKCLTAHGEYHDPLQGTLKIADAGLRDYLDEPWRVTEEQREAGFSKFAETLNEEN